MKLLLAEDEAALSRVLVTILKKNNYSVDAVYDGISALEHLETDIYDGAILDIMMPGTDGITVLKNLRKKGNKMPVMLLTAKAEVEDRVTGLENGANDYLPKPFDTRELLARVKTMMQIQSIPTEELAAGNIRLDMATLEISSEKSSFRLSGKEFLMMKIFMTNPGILIPAEMLFDRIWGTDSKEKRQMVWVYISFLRRKLKALHADVEIITVDKKFYQLEGCVS